MERTENQEQDKGMPLYSKLSDNWIESSEEEEHCMSDTDYQEVEGLTPGLSAGEGALQHTQAESGLNCPVTFGKMSGSGLNCPGTSGEMSGSGLNCPVTSGKMSGSGLNCPVTSGKMSGSGLNCPGTSGEMAGGGFNCPETSCDISEIGFHDSGNSDEMLYIKTASNSNDCVIDKPPSLMDSNQNLLSDVTETVPRRSTRQRKAPDRPQYN